MTRVHQVDGHRTPQQIGEIVERETR
jgi:hypothetical protein